MYGGRRMNQTALELSLYDDEKHIDPSAGPPR